MPVDIPALSSQATFQILGLDDTPTSLLDRWSNTYVSLPAAVAVPHNEADIASLIAYAKQQKLSIVVAAGKHLASVPVTSKTLYVDMKEFASVRIDKRARTVLVGGGATTGAVLDELHKAGYYTSVPNTNTVGFIGAFLGGGSSALNSVNGFMIDHAVVIRVVTADGKVLELGPDSEGEQASLWHVLRGAGHGLGVVTELTLRIYPISELRMDDDKIWLRTTVFPPPALGVAARTFAKLQPVHGPIGAPVIVLTAAYYGPSAAAEKALRALLEPEVVNAAVFATTAFVPMASINDGTKKVEARGGFKRSEATLLRNPVAAATIERLYNRYLQLAVDAPDTMSSGVVFYAFDSRALAERGSSEAARREFFERRDARCIVYHDVWFSEETSAIIADAYLPEPIAIARCNETGSMKRFANFLRHPANLAETYSEGKIAEKKRVKGLWDLENIFWTPGL